MVPYGPVEVSPDSGTTWTDRNPGDGWVSFAESANGDILALVGALHYFSFSTNSGTTWSEEVGLPRYSDVWSLLACSADGERLAIVDNISTIPTSSDVLFISHSGGTNIAAGGGIYTWQTTPTPVLAVVVSGGNAIVSWIVPSGNFVLQENQDLNSTNWTDVPESPTLDYSTLRNQVVIPAPPGTMFYRLVSR